MKPPYRCTYPAPTRVWEKGENGQWSSREWLKGEMEAYEKAVLGRRDK
jgi:hypothetical protein